jgi:hypothetical protein
MIVCRSIAARVSPSTQDQVIRLGHSTLCWPLKIINTATAQASPSLPELHT